MITLNEFCELNRECKFFNNDDDCKKFYYGLQLKDIRGAICILYSAFKKYGLYSLNSLCNPNWNKYTDLSSKIPMKDIDTVLDFGIFCELFPEVNFFDNENLSGVFLLTDLVHLEGDDDFEIVNKFNYYLTLVEKYSINPESFKTNVSDIVDQFDDDQLGDIISASVIYRFISSYNGKKVDFSVLESKLKLFVDRNKYKLLLALKLTDDVMNKKIVNMISNIDVYSLSNINDYMNYINNFNFDVIHPNIRKLLTFHETSI